MFSPEMKKAPALGGATGAIKNRSTNNQKEETMTPIQPHAADKFSTTFTLPSVNVGSITTRIGALTGGDQPDETVIVLDVPERGAALTPAQALSLAAALQASSVHVMEQAEEVAA